MRILCTFVVALLLIPVEARAEVSIASVTPSEVDPAATTFDSPHAVYVNRDIVVENKPGLAEDRHQLLLWLTGTGGKAEAAAKGFCSLAADLGYHVISLMYADDVPASVCAYDSDPKAFETFRLAIIRGGSASYQDGRKTLTIGPAECIEVRLTRLLEHLQKRRPEESWAQFLQGDGAIRWGSVAVAGQSQGGGHAALIGIQHTVARVLCFGAPKDYSKRLRAPATWYRTASATPKARFFAFNHRQDPVGCTPEQLLENLKALGLDPGVGSADADADRPPYHHARVLFTGYPDVGAVSPRDDQAKAAHGSAISTKNADRRKQVWTYMLTE